MSRSVAAQHTASSELATELCFQVLNAMNKPSERLKAAEEVMLRADEALKKIAKKAKTRNTLKAIGGGVLAIAGLCLAPFSFVIASSLAATGGLIGIYNLTTAAAQRQRDDMGAKELENVRTYARLQSDGLIATKLKKILKTPYLKENFLDRFPNLEARFKSVAIDLTTAEVDAAIRHNRFHPAKP